MRKLMYFTLGFATAIASCAYVDAPFWKYFLVMGILPVLCMIEKKQKFLRKLTVSVMGSILGFFWFSQFYAFYLAPVQPLDGRIIPLAVRAADYGECNDYATFFDGTVYLEGKHYPVQTRLNGTVGVEPGMCFAGRFAVRVVDTGVDPERSTFLAVYQEGTVTRGTARENWWDTIAQLRLEIKQILLEVFPEDTAPFAKALLLGDTSDLGYAIDSDMKVSGVRHVVAVSGLHISILFGLLSMLTFRKRFLTALVGYPILFFFGALAGFTPSVVRSCLMWGLVLLGKLANREYDGPTALSFAVLMMLVLDPMVVMSVGFQLSVASVAGIFLFTPGILLWLRSFFPELKENKSLSFFMRGVTSSVSVTLGVNVFTIPLCAYYFGMISLVSVITNLLVLWVIGGIFYGIMVICLIYWAVPAVSSILASLVSYPIRYVLWIVKIIADFPIAAVYTVSPYITAWIVFVYGMLTVFLISENKRPLILSCCAAMGLCVALLADWTEAAADDMRLTVLDVGQGQCLLLQSEGRAFVVDCGGDFSADAADRAAEALLVQGIQQLDGMILTHMDEDHAGGAEELLSRIRTEILILPEVYSELALYTDAQVICAAEDLEITFDDTAIRIYPPTFPGNSNEKSLCVLFDTKKCDILITGDRDGYGERSLLRHAQIPDVDVLIAGHHGAASSCCQELLDAVRPEIVCISVGEGNHYGHPASELLQRLAAFGCDIYRTDMQGTITIRR